MDPTALESAPIPARSVFTTPVVSCSSSSASKLAKSSLPNTTPAPSDCSVEGTSVGVVVGTADGAVVGMADGAADGTIVGVAVGVDDGAHDGAVVGGAVGICDGAADGTGVGAISEQNTPVNGATQSQL